MVKLPASKSISNRLLLIQALAEGGRIENLSSANDTKIMQQALQAIAKGETTINIGDAGTAARFITAYCAVTQGSFVIEGSERMHQRPIAPLVEALRQAGADITYLGEEGFLPLHIEGGTLLGGLVTIRADVSSQFISALLMIGLYCKQGLNIVLEGEPVSTPYIEMTDGLMQKFGVVVDEIPSGYSVAPQVYKFVNAKVEADWSAASYMYAMVALAKRGRVELPNLDYSSLQGDRGINDVFFYFDVTTIFTDDGIIIEKTGLEEQLTTTLETDLNFMPDIAQTLAVVAAGKGIDLTMTGLQTLAIKETDRLVALETELAKFGVKTERGLDWFRVLPSNITKPAQPINTYNDHRMAMAFAPLALVVGDLEFDNGEVVKKSFPKFWSEIEKLGFTIVAG